MRLASLALYQPSKPILCVDDCVYLITQTQQVRALSGLEILRCPAAHRPEGIYGVKAINGQFFLDNAYSHFSTRDGGSAVMLLGLALTVVGLLAASAR